MRKLALSIALVLAGCAQPAKIGAKMTVISSTAGDSTLNLEVKNLEDRPTTPLRVELRLDGQRAGSEPLLHPAPFVLNKREARTMSVHVKLPSPPPMLHLTVAEQESGRVLKDERIHP